MSGLELNGKVLKICVMLLSHWINGVFPVVLLDEKEKREEERKTLYLLATA